MNIFNILYYFVSINMNPKFKLPRYLMDRIKEYYVDRGVNGEFIGKTKQQRLEAINDAAIRARVEFIACAGTMWFSKGRRLTLTRKFNKHNYWIGRYVGYRRKSK